MYGSGLTKNNALKVTKNNLQTSNNNTNIKMQWFVKDKSSKEII